jgi:hypothetical protein
MEETCRLISLAKWTFAALEPAAIPRMSYVQRWDTALMIGFGFEQAAE